jgi:hypothetical protein
MEKKRKEKKKPTPSEIPGIIGPTSPFFSKHLPHFLLGG